MIKATSNTQVERYFLNGYMAVHYSTTSYKKETSGASLIKPQQREDFVFDIVTTDCQTFSLQSKI